MVEELKVIAEIFSNASQAALTAYILYLLHSIGKIAIVVIPLVSCVKFIVNRMFVNDKPTK